MASISAESKPLPTPVEDIETRFRRLADTWEADVAHHSSTSIQNSHPAYLEIIGIGWQAVPLLLRDLRSTGRPWFASLKAITCADPVAPEERGDVAKLTEAWLRWGREQGYAC
jgi:hypothetical protein